MGFELITLVVIGTDCISSCKSHYHTITATAAPKLFGQFQVIFEPVWDYRLFAACKYVQFYNFFAAEDKVKVDSNEDHVNEPSAPVVQLDMSESDVRKLCNKMSGTCFKSSWNFILIEWVIVI
jgi:hypothetical protein